MAKAKGKTKELKIPDELRGAYNNLIRRIPDEYLDEPHIKDTILAYLKLGKKNLADHFLKTLTQPFSEQFILRQMQTRDESLDDDSDPEDDDDMAITDTPALDSSNFDDDTDDAD